MKTRTAHSGTTGGGLRSAKLARIDAYRADWCLFAREILGVNLDREQEAILSAVQTCPRVSVASGTARGKDFVSAVAAVCFFVLTPRWTVNRQGNLEMAENTKVALTAPTDRQVKNIMIPEISRLYSRAKSRGFELPGKLNSSDIRTGWKEWFLTGFKADEHNHEAWSGFHAVHTMFVITEATGISDDTFGAIEGNLQGDSRILLVFNPNISVGYAARSQSGDRWEKFRLNSLTAPNVEQKRIVIPGQVDYEWVVDKIENWCMPIPREDVTAEQDDFEFEGQWYRPDDLFRKKVLGKFPKVSDDVLIPRQWLEMAHQRWRDNVSRVGSEHVYELIRNAPSFLGVDVAGMGRDSTCYVWRKGSWVEKFECVNSAGQANHMGIAGTIVGKTAYDPSMFVSIDTIGEGAGVYSRCLETARDASRIISCKYSEAARSLDGRELTDSTGQMRFLNLRAYLFWAVREWLDPKQNSGAMLPPDDRFDEEACEIKWLFKSDGRLAIEPKEDIKARLGRSPDCFDALANTFYPLNKIPRSLDLGAFARRFNL